MGSTSGADAGVTSAVAVDETLETLNRPIFFSLFSGISRFDFDFSIFRFRLRRNAGLVTR
jgi:hypothetical protein